MEFLSKMQTIRARALIVDLNYENLVVIKMYKRVNE